MDIPPGKITHGLLRVQADGCFRVLEGKAQVRLVLAFAITAVSRPGPHGVGEAVGGVGLDGFSEYGNRRDGGSETVAIVKRQAFVDPIHGRQLGGVFAKLCSQRRAFGVALRLQLSHPGLEGLQLGQQFPVALFGGLITGQVLAVGQQLFDAGLQGAGVDHHDHHHQDAKGVVFHERFFPDQPGPGDAGGEGDNFITGDLVILDHGEGQQEGPGLLQGQALGFGEGRRAGAVAGLIFPDDAPHFLGEGFFRRPGAIG